jgi:hypothetical protein
MPWAYDLKRAITLYLIRRIEQRQRILARRRVEEVRAMERWFDSEHDRLEEKRLRLDGIVAETSHDRALRFSGSRPRWLFW